MMKFFLTCRHYFLIFTWHILCFYCICILWKICLYNILSCEEEYAMGSDWKFIWHYFLLSTTLYIHSQSSLLWLGSSALCHHRLTEGVWHTSLYTTPQELWHYNVFNSSSPPGCCERTHKSACNSCLTVVHVCSLGHMFSVILSRNMVFLWLWHSEFHEFFISCHNIIVYSWKERLSPCRLNWSFNTIDM